MCVLKICPSLLEPLERGVNWVSENTCGHVFSWRSHPTCGIAHRLFFCTTSAGLALENPLLSPRRKGKSTFLKSLPV